MSDLGTFLDALEKLPPTGGLTLRGLTAAAGSVPPLGVLTGIVASTRDPRVATENFSVGTLLLLLGRTGRDLSAMSAHPSDAEVVHRPGAIWHRLPDLALPDVPLTVVALEELDPSGRYPATDWPATLTELAARADALVQDALARPAVVVSRPGNFAGPWPAQVVAA